MLSFELNQALTFNNVKEAQRDSIYRISSVLRMKGKFIPAEEYRSLSDEQRGKSGVFVKDDALKSPLDSRPADSAFFNTIYNFMNERSIDECRNMIDDYARNEGTTWNVTRPACNLEKIAPPTSIDRPVFLDASEKRAKRLCALSDALAAAALDLISTQMPNAAH